MNTVKIACVFLLLLIHQIHTLRCRSGNQQISNEFRRTMQKCKNHYSGSSRTGDDNFSSSNNDNSSDEDSNSDEILFEHDFFTGSRKNDSQSMGRDEMRNNQRNDRNNRNNFSNSRNNSNMGSNRMSNGNSNNNWNAKRNNRDMEDDDNSNNGHSGQSCSIQCFFNELNLVDQRGYPERSAVTGTLMRGVQDPMLRDFIEESIMECFHFVSSIMNQDKCKFSERLFTCFAEKGREGCEDWDENY